MVSVGFITSSRPDVKQWEKKKNKTLEKGDQWEGDKRGQYRVNRIKIHYNMYGNVKINHIIKYN